MQRKQIPELVIKQLDKWLELTNYGTNSLNEKQSRMLTIIAMMGHDIDNVSHEFVIQDDPGYNKIKKESDAILEKVLEDRGFKSLGVDIFYKVLYEEDGGIFAIYRTSRTPTSINISISGNAEYVTDILNDLVSRSPSRNLHPISDWVASSLEDVSRRVTTIPKNDPTLFDTFYPFLDKPPKQWWKDFAASNSNIALLVGPPGTGKSNFIKSCIDSFEPDDALKLNICSDESALLVPTFTRCVRDCPDSSLFIIEDADRLISARSDGNTSMSSLLNTLSGVLSSTVKIIVTTNTPNIHMVDEALRRPGRTHSILEFGKLTVDQANIARQTIGKPSIDFDLGEEYTLAQALNWDVGNASQASVKGPGFM